MLVRHCHSAPADSPSSWPGGCCEPRPAQASRGYVGLRAAVIADPAIGELLAARYLAPLSTLGDFGDQLLDSVRTYFASGQRIDEAAKALFVHPNTLRYRLARFEDTTRCDLHSAENIAEIWWVLTRSTM